MSHKTENPYNNRHKETVDQHHLSIQLVTKALREAEKQEDISFFDNHFLPIVMDLQEIKHELKTVSVLCLFSFVMNGVIILMVLNNG